MFKFIRNIGCLSIIILVVFLFVAVLFGGEKIRDIGDKTTGIIKKAMYYAADKADSIHKEVLKKIDELGKPFKKNVEKNTDNKKH